ncbi:MAG: proprotein convertase P-domain-containing protein [Pirellulales bacterium]
MMSPRTRRSKLSAIGRPLLRSRRFHLERLEDRSLMAVLIGGDAKVSEGFPYQLNLTSDQPVTQWSIDWDGNGSTDQTIMGNPSSVSHLFSTTGTTVGSIRAKALIGGVEVPATVSAGGQFAQTLLAAGSDAPQGNTPWITFGPDGDLYVSSLGTNSVRRYDAVTGALLAELTAPGSNALDAPTDLTFGPNLTGDSSPDLFVSSFNDSRVLLFDGATGAYVRDFIPSGVGGLLNARDLAFGPDGNLYVTSVNTREILRFDGATGNFLNVAYACPTTDQSISSFAFRSDGGLFIAEYLSTASSRVIQVNPSTGQVLSELAPRRLGGLNYAQIEFGPDGDLYAANFNENEVLHFDGISGAFLGVLAAGIGDSYIRSIEFGPDGSLYASGIDSASNFSRVNRYEGPWASTATTAVPVTVLDAKTYAKTKIEKLPSPGSISPLSSTISVPDAGAVYDVKVTLNATAPLPYLRARLVSPAGTTIDLLPATSKMSGSILRGTVLYADAFQPVAAGTAPYTGDFRPWPGDLGVFAGQQAQGTWTLKVSMTGAPGGSKGTLDGWSLTISRDANLLQAESLGTGGETSTLSVAQATPFVTEAMARWQAAGNDTSALRGVNVQIADLGGTTLGLAAGNTLWLDDNAAGWGWFVDSTPRDDAEFALPGNQGEQDRMDLLTVVMHELGHLLGRGHDEEGLMAETLAAGVRSTGLEHNDVFLVDQVFRQGDGHRADAWLGAWLSDQFDSMHGRGKRPR